MLKHLIRLARPKQWLKNGFVLAPLIFAGEAFRLDKVETALAAAAIFCLLSSAVYIFNDLADRESDQKHPLKKNRPIASGAVSPLLAGIMIVVLLAAGMTWASFINYQFVTISALFLALNVLYSLVLKHVVILDAMSVAVSFVLRAYGGAAAISVVASPWMMINTLFLALFLAFGKRRHELVLLDAKAIEHRKILGKYSPYLLDQLIGVTTPAVVIMYMLYSFSPDTQEKLGTPYLYLTIPFVVYGIFRYLYLIHKEEKGEPTTIFVTDLPLILTMILWVITAGVILYWF